MGWGVSRAVKNVAMLLWFGLLSGIFAAAVYAGGGPLNVLVVQNKASSISRDIASYYVQRRGIPPENVCTINCPTDEIVDYTVCESSIKAPILAFLQNPQISGRIDYIVLTKGVPLGANYKDPSTGSYYSSGPLAVNSVLTCLSEPSETCYFDNPYGPTMGARVVTSFSHQLSLGGLHLYLVTRLDGYTEQDVDKMIDGSVSASCGTPPTGSIAIDRCVTTSPSWITMNNRLATADTTLVSKGVPVIYDNTAAIMGNMSGLAGYFGWGSNDSTYNYDPNYTGSLPVAQYYLSVIQSNTFAPGSIADVYVSSSARTFLPQVSTVTLIADFIARGASGAGGYVSEPYTAYSTWPDVLTDRYTSGYNFAESYYMACPELYWKTVVVGDPLMAPYAPPFNFTVNVPSDPVGGTVTITASTLDPAGFASVSFYLDGNLIGTATSQPFAVNLDTTQYTVGPHQIMAVGTQATPVAVQSSVTATLTIQNAISNLSKIGDAFISPDGQGVRATGKIVTAGTADMGGNEFYIQDEGGYVGIKVISTQLVDQGDVVTVVGDLTTDSSERSIMASEVDVTNHMLGPVPALFMSNRAVGGAACTPETGGVTGGCGARNIGTLVKTCGKVTYSGAQDEDYFYIDDGGVQSDLSGGLGLNVECGSLIKPNVGSWVTVTGISSSEECGDMILPLIKARTQTDICIISN